MAKRYAHSLSFRLKVDDGEFQDIEFQIITNEPISYGVDILPMANKGQILTYDAPCLEFSHECTD